MDEEYDEEEVDEYEKNLANYDKMVEGEGGGPSTSCHRDKSKNISSKSDEVISDESGSEGNHDIIELDNSYDVEQEAEVILSDNDETKGVESDIEEEGEYEDDAKRAETVGNRRSSGSLDSLLDSDGEEKGENR